MNLNTDIFEDPEANIQETLIRVIASLESENIRLKKALRAAHSISRRQFIGEKVAPHQWDQEIQKVLGSVKDTICR